jgi:16S rRNA (guanine966-N2)-methyltransferase
VREALAGIWSEAIPGARVLDLFAGSGAMGIEALSRGASKVTFVESGKRVLPVLRQNCQDLVQGRSEIIRACLPRACGQIGAGGFDLIFADPPYAFQDYSELLRQLRPIAEAGTAVVVEHSRRVELAFDTMLWRLLEQRRYGETKLTFLAPA